MIPGIEQASKVMHSSRWGYWTQKINLCLMDVRRWEVINPKKAPIVGIFPAGFLPVWGNRLSSACFGQTLHHSLPSQLPGRGGLLPQATKHEENELPGWSAATLILMSRRASNVSVIVPLSQMSNSRSSVALTLPQTKTSLHTGLRSLLMILESFLFPLTCKSAQFNNSGNLRKRTTHSRWVLRAMTCNSLHSSLMSLKDYG